MPDEEPSAGLEEIARTLSAARVERNPARARSLFETALRMCDAWHERGGGTKALIVKAQTYSELAPEESTAKSRTALWKCSLNTLAVQPDEREVPEPEIAQAYGSLAVDCFQDLFCDLDFRSRQEILRIARNRLDSELEKAGDPEIAAVLLARKSSVLRHLALSELNLDTRANRLQKAVRCAARAVQQTRNRFTLLELGLSEWALARHESTDERYVTRLRSAEEHLTDESLVNYEPAQLALARFYAGSQLGRLQNLNSERLMQVVGAFEGAWREELSVFLNGPRKAALDSVLSLRNQIAHGRSVGLTYVQIHKYYSHIKEIVGFLEKRFT